MKPNCMSAAAGAGRIIGANQIFASMRLTSSDRVSKATTPARLLSK